MGKRLYDVHRKYQYTSTIRVYASSEDDARNRAFEDDGEVVSDADSADDVPVGSGAWDVERVSKR